MSSFRIGVGALIAAMGCTPIDPAQNTFPQQPEPTQFSGPPGGQMDPGYGYQAPDQPGYPQGYQQGYPQGYPEGTEDQAAAATAQAPEPSADPSAPGYAMGDVDDGEISATLDSYGSWGETADYGRVWRPDTTVVGVDFTPYETGGSWIWSDSGWNYDCDYNWGWLPFHYGRWGWFDGSWGWQPGYQWTPGAVEWRGGGGYTGWRPLPPVPHDQWGGNVRDHRTNAAVIARDSQWRFSRDTDFGHGHIRGHLFQNPAEGLRVTAMVDRPGLRGNYTPVNSASLMRGRLAARSFNVTNGGGGVRPNVREPQAGFRTPPPAMRTQQPVRGDTPTWRRPEPTYRAPQQTYRAPQQTYRPTYNPPQRTYNPPQRSYNPPQRSYNPPQRSYTPPTAYGGSFSPSQHSSGGGGGGWSRPSGGGGGGGRTFTPSSSSGGSHSSGGGGGGAHASGGHHR